MSESATFSYLDGYRRVSVLLEPNGTTLVQMLEPESLHVQSEYPFEIEPVDAQRLVAELFEVAPNVPPSPDGEIWVRLSQGDQYWDYAFQESAMPQRELDIARITRMIADDAVAEHVSPARLRREKTEEVRMTPLGFVKWTVFFMAGFILAVVVGLIGKILTSFIGPLAYSVAVGFSLFLMEGSFYKVGEYYAEEYRGSFPVLAPAALASLICFLIYFQLAGALSLLSIFWFLLAPGFAVMGDNVSRR